MFGASKNNDMDAIITNHKVLGGDHYFNISTEGQETRVTVYADGRLNVCVMNAMARVYRTAMGRVFESVNEAMAAYKSSKTRTAIALAYEIAPDFDRAAAGVRNEGDLHT